MDLCRNIIATLSYFNMFDYPLKKWEIFNFLGCSIRTRDFENALDLLLDHSAIHKVGEYYSISNNPDLALRRSNGNRKAAYLLKKAEYAATIISIFPFVKGVAVSGSLSKQYADDRTDVDFFIITTAGRLWIARTLLHLFKKLTFLFRLQKYFCMNYFVDESALTIVEKNIYTATEITTILPLRGIHIFDQFYKVNSWTKKFLPNNYLHISTSREVGRSVIKKMLEMCFDNKLGDVVDNWLMAVTRRKWDSKTRRGMKDGKGELLGLHVNRHFCKPDPTAFQQKVLDRYKACVSNIDLQFKGLTIIDAGVV